MSSHSKLAPSPILTDFEGFLKDVKSIRKAFFTIKRLLSPTPPPCHLPLLPLPPSLPPPPPPPPPVLKQPAVERHNASVEPQRPISQGIAALFQDSSEKIAICHAVVKSLFEASCERWIYFYTRLLDGVQREETRKFFRGGISIYTAMSATGDYETRHKMSSRSIINSFVMQLPHAAQNLRSVLLEMSRNRQETTPEKFMEPFKKAHLFVSSFTVLSLNLFLLVEAADGSSPLTRDINCKELNSSKAALNILAANIPKLSVHSPAHAFSNLEKDVSNLLDSIHKLLEARLPSVIAFLEKDLSRIELDGATPDEILISASERIFFDTSDIPVLDNILEVLRQVMHTHSINPQCVPQDFIEKTSSLCKSFLRLYDIAGLEFFPNETGYLMGFGQKFIRPMLCGKIEDLDKASRNIDNAKIELCIKAASAIPKFFVNFKPFCVDIQKFYAQRIANLSYERLATYNGMRLFIQRAMDTTLSLINSTPVCQDAIPGGTGEAVALLQELERAPDREVGPLIERMEPVWNRFVGLLTRQAPRLIPPRPALAASQSPLILQ